MQHFSLTHSSHSNQPRNWNSLFLFSLHIMRRWRTPTRRWGHTVRIKKWTASFYMKIAPTNMKESEREAIERKRSGGGLNGERGKIWYVCSLFINRTPIAHSLSLLFKTLSFSYCPSALTSSLWIFFCRYFFRSSFLHWIDCFWRPMKRSHLRRLN